MKKASPSCLLPLAVFALAVTGATTPGSGQGRASFQPPAQVQTPAPAPAPPPAPSTPKPRTSTPPPQAALPAAAPTAAPSPTPTNEAPPPYEPQLLRLGEMMGALSYLRDLCGANDGAALHDKYAQLMDVETQSPERREALAGAFNRGFDGYQLTYRSCTPSAHETISHFLDETQKLAREVATRYGG